MISNGHFKHNLLCCDVNSVRAAEVYAAFPYCLEFLCFLAFLLVFFYPFPGSVVSHAYCRQCACLKCPSHTFLCCGLSSWLLDLNGKIVRRCKSEHEEASCE